MKRARPALQIGAGPRIAMTEMTGDKAMFNRRQLIAATALTAMTPMLRAQTAATD